LGFARRTQPTSWPIAWVAQEWLEKDVTGKLLPGRGFHDLPIIDWLNISPPGPGHGPDDWGRST